MDIGLIWEVGNLDVDVVLIGLELGDFGVVCCFFQYCLSGMGVMLFCMLLGFDFDIGVEYWVYKVGDVFGGEDIGYICCVICVDYNVIVYFVIGLVSELVVWLNIDCDDKCFDFDYGGVGQCQCCVDLVLFGCEDVGLQVYIDVGFMME